MMSQCVLVLSPMKYTASMMQISVCVKMHLFADIFFLLKMIKMDKNKTDHVGASTFINVLKALIIIQSFRQSFSQTKSWKLILVSEEVWKIEIKSGNNAKKCLEI